jgi:hypothetical protein
MKIRDIICEASPQSMWKTKIKAKHGKVTFKTKEGGDPSTINAYDSNGTPIGYYRKNGTSNILESDYSEIEDEADSRGDADLITILEYLRTQASESAAVTPRVKVDTVIDRVRSIPGNEGFNYAALEAAHEHNDTVKSLIKDIKDDEKSGSKYIYLALPENTVDSEDPLGAQGAKAGDSSKIVSKMASAARK